MAAYCGTSDEDALSDSVCDAVTTDAWKGQLDFDRACSGPEQRCWLSTELTPWNRVMHGLAFELVELRPGKLCLRPTPQDDGDRDRGTVDAEASFLVSWLLQHHPCIDELKVAPSVHFQGTGVKKTSFPIRLRPAGVSGSFRTIRGLEVGTNGSCLIISAREALAKAQYHFTNKKPTRHSLYELEDLEAVGGLVRLKFVALREIEPVYFAKLAKLLRRNPNSIKRLEISLRNLPRQVNHALGYLFSCESLMISSYNDDGHRASLPSMKPVARLLHSSTALKELSITPVANRTQISAIAKELETNTSLAKLDLRMADSRCSPKALFTALQVNTTLKELQVTDCRISGECGQALALLLQKNTGLRLLYIKDSVISASTLAVLVTALTRNTTLESLQLSSGVLPKNGIVELCKVLRINKTLKKLQFTDLECPKKFRAALARQLARDDCYNRVQLPWIERDLPGLTAALTSAFAGFEELHLSGIHCMSEAGLKQLFDALASNKCVRTLKVRVSGDPREKGRGLCEMLKVNRSIECFDLSITDDTYKLVEEVLHALAENVGITKIVLSIDVYRMLNETATAISYFLAHHSTVTKFFVRSGIHLSPNFLDEFSQGMVQNKTIVKFGLIESSLGTGINAGFQVYEAVRRNRGALNRAVDFVVAPSVDRQCAEGFELFNGRPCLLKHLMKVTGKTEPEALLAIAAAEYYLRDNYLLITGIVQHSVKCHPAQGTQVDALNKRCWQAIARHLKVADVIP